jgi:hypothetical protein
VTDWPHDRYVAWAFRLALFFGAAVAGESAALGQWVPLAVFISLYSLLCIIDLDEGTPDD